MQAPQNCYAAGVMTSTLKTWKPRLALPLFALALSFSSLGCKAKEKKAPAPTAAEETTTAAPAPSNAQPKPEREAASEADRALAKDFIVRFTKIIEASKSDGWLELQSTARREQLLAKDAVENSYSGWVTGTAPVLEAIRSSDFRLEKLPTGQLLLTFDGVMVPNHPEAVYEIHMVTEEGELRMDES